MNLTTTQTQDQCHDADMPNIEPDCIAGVIHSGTGRCLGVVLLFKRCPSLYTLCLSIMLSSCGGGESDSSSEPSGLDDSQHTTQQVSAGGTGEDNTRQVLESIYYNRRTPSGFHSEIQPDPGVYQTIRHIKNTDIMDPASIDTSTPHYELCTNDFTEALAWSTIASANLGELVDNSDYILYYQFTYSPLATPEISNIQRIYKCNILDRSGIDIRNPGDTRGKYTEPNQNVANIKLLIEYLWSFTEFNNYGNAILNSTVTDTTENFSLHMDHARLTSAVELNSTCDRIDLYRVSYQIDKISGNITVSESRQLAIDSIFENQEIRICED